MDVPPPSPWSLNPVEQSKGPEMIPFFIPLLATVPSPVSGFETWCGKYYEIGSPQTPPVAESRFSYPNKGDQKLLDFKCSTASSIYLPGDDKLDPPAIIFDAEVTYDVGQPVYVSDDEGASMNVSVWLGSTQLLENVEIQLGSKGSKANITLSSLGLDTSTDPQEITCIANLAGQEYTDTAELLYLPENPYNGSSVKIDRETGYLKVQHEAGQAWESVLPFGFYDSINTTETEGKQVTGDLPIPEPSSYTERGEPNRTNIERLQIASRLNYTMVHPVPPGNSYRPNGNETAIYKYFDEAERLGLGVMYDMRHSFSDMSLVQPQIEEFRARKGLLVWYTADEPDGPVTPLNSTISARNLIRSLDPYHPIALVLNCADHYWTEYSSGADILMLDPYPIAINMAFSKKWSTPVTSDYGCPGCDGCQGTMYDIANRIDDYTDRARITGKKRVMPLWIVPQMFNDWGDEFWWRIPTGDEGAVQVVLAWNHGIKGHCAWIASSASNDLLYNASFIATQLLDQTSFVIDSANSRRQVQTSLEYDGQNGVDVAAWTRVREEDGVEETLILAARLFYTDVEFELQGINGTVKEVLFGTVNITDSGGPLFVMPRTSVAGLIIESHST